MAGKNSKKLAKNSKKNKKNHLKSISSSKKTKKINKEKVSEIKKKNSGGRGRPPLKWHVKLRRKIKNTFKKIKKRLKKNSQLIKKTWLIALKNLGLKKGRGRKKLPIKVRLERYFQKWKKEKHKNKKRRQKKIKFWRKKILRFLHLSKKVGRPSKKELSKKEKRLHFKNFFSQKRELFHFRIGSTQRKKRFSIKLSFISSFVFTGLFLAAAYGSYDLIFKDLPSAADLVNKKQNLTTRILDRNGNLLYGIYEDENRTLVSLSSVSDYLVDATIAIEDQNFYHHIGFSLQGIMRALVANASGEEIQGGSTITQQLIKKRLLSDERTIKRKLREILLSVVVEGVYEKDEILEMYLNTVPYGGSTYGIEQAAWNYFNKSAKDLDLAEAALLAGLPQAPSTYSPFGSNPELSKMRQAEVLRRMVEDGYISQLQADSAKAEKLVFRQDRIEIEAPHFVMYVKKLLAEQYGEDLIASGGLEIRTSLDLNLQDEVKSIVSTEITKLARMRITNGAALVTNPKTGEILAMLGGADYFDFAHDGQVNVILRPRQPGSSIKPLTYALAFESGMTPASFVEDSPITYQIPGSKPYSPRNYDGKFHGKVTLREALASSYNIPAVKTLAQLGVSSLIDKGEQLGITTWTDRSRFGLSLTLGAGEVRMIDLAQVYSSFANLGYPVEPNPFLEIKNSEGRVLYRNDCALDEANCYENLQLSPKAAYSITDILKDNRARSSAFGLHSVLNIPGQEVAVKTGTTNSMKDNWTVGYTTDRLVATWVGNNDNTPMSYVASGITGASPIWNKIFLLLLDEENPHQFTMPANLLKIKICAITGTLPCGACPKIVEEVFTAGTEPTRACNNEYFVELARQKEEEARQRAAQSGGQVF